jgi:hypothetical protein
MGLVCFATGPKNIDGPILFQQVELSFQTGAIITVYGDMDEDGFYMGELDGVRGLVPSNFLTEAPDQYGTQQPTANSVAQRNLSNNRGRGLGPGARGPPPPPRDAMGRQVIRFSHFFLLFSFIFCRSFSLVKIFAPRSAISQLFPGLSHSVVEIADAGTDLQNSLFH